jgi:hypothetical protein
MKQKTIIALLASALLAPALAFADTPLPIDGGWQSFSFGTVGSHDNEGLFTFLAPGAVDLKVTDAFLAGDQFSIYDNSSFIGNTSVPLGSGDDIGANADGAYADPLWSSGLFVLGAGAHSIDIVTLQSPFGGGGAYIRADTSTSVPDVASTLPLLGFALMGLAAMARRISKA